MPKIELTDRIKKRLIVISLIIGYSFIHTLLVAVLMAKSPNTIYYHFSTGLLIGILGCLTVYIVYKVDGFITKLIAKPSKFVFLLSFLISFFTAAIMFALLAWSLNIILRDNWSLNFSFFKEQLIIINYLFILILSYYTVTYFSRSTELKNKKLRSENVELNIALNKYLTRIPSLSNKKTILLPAESIYYFKIENGIIFSYTEDDKKYPLTIQTIKELEKKLNPTLFFRINRSEIINIEKISSFEPYFKDRLALKFRKFPTVLYTSNKKAASFREWISNSSI